MAAVSGTVAASLVSAGALAWGAFERNSPLFGRVQRRLDGRDAFVALTFDDGPNPQATPSVLGRHADRWPSLVRRMREEGHVIANHGYHHRKLTFRSPRYVRDDIARGTAAIQRASDSRPALFRAPHGHRNPWVTSIARAEGQRTVGWTLGVWDSARPGVSIIADRAIRGADPGAIILLHDGDGYDAFGDRTQTAAAVPAIIRGLRERGFAFVGLD
jgi:peptidoglycan/xylan/chitin deacetylase (PgdA/CDA1 family)